MSQPFAPSSPSAPPAQRRVSIGKIPTSPLRSTSPPLSSPTTPTANNLLQAAASAFAAGGRRPSTAPSPQAQTQKTTKARDLLRKHYGLGVGPPSSSGKNNDPMNLDSPAFDARSYYEQLITTSSLPVLLKRENELMTEIRELDSERQSLVYNHHSDLIAASDTIGAVKSRAESLEADLDLLRAAFSEISRLASEVSVGAYRPTPRGSELGHAGREEDR